MAYIVLPSSDWLLELDIVATSDLKIVALIELGARHHILILWPIFIQLKH
jgi:hypothetical protein